MKRIKKIIVLSVLLSYCISGAAQQQEIDSATFCRLVDYVNCKYTEAYIDAYIKNKPARNDVKKYNKNIKPELRKCTIEKPIKFEEFSQLLKNNEWTTTENTLSIKINEKKQKFAEFSRSDLNGRIKILIELDNVNASIISEAVKATVKTTVEQELQKLQKFLTPENTQGTTTTSDTTSPPPHQEDWKFWIIIAGIILSIVIHIIVFGWLLKYEKKQDYEKSDDKLLEHLKKIERKLQMVEEELQQLKNLPQTDSKQPIINVSQDVPENIPVVEFNVKYLKMKSGDYLSQESDSQENCKFKLFDINGDTAKFEFCGNEQDAIANKNATFDTVCEDSNYVANATHIENLEPGEVRRQPDGKWKVIKKAKIKFV
jgi:hypothetical protein